ncbi:MAG: septum formation protein Maf [Clostridia bacterium]|nr:septum formation protein Maf [Clostridia bacterium]
MKMFILASASPRRKDILKAAGYSFEIIPSDKEQLPVKGVSPEKLAVRNACLKAEDVFKRIDDPNSVVLGADTVVALSGNIYGKPSDEDDARRILNALSGRTHQVITGYCLISGNMRESGSVVTDVAFNILNDDQIEAYIKSGLFVGKAGAYGIQDGFGLIKGFNGYYDNVVGLPLEAIEESLKEFLK